MAKMPDDPYYDIYEDWPLIESSIAKQYGINIREKKDMPFSQFQVLLSGLMPDTPLGNIVAIRSEKDKDVIKHFSKYQMREHNKWKNKLAVKKLEQPQKLDEVFKNYEKMFEKLYSDNK